MQSSRIPLNNQNMMAPNGKVSATIKLFKSNGFPIAYAPYKAKVHQISLTDIPKDTHSPILWYGFSINC